MGVVIGNDRGFEGLIIRGIFEISNDRFSGKAVALKSTGPTTEEGKEHSRCNAVRLRGSDVENSNSVRVALKAKRGDCIVNVGDVGVEAAEIAFAFCTAFAQRSHRACLYHFEKIEPRR